MVKSYTHLFDTAVYVGSVTVKTGLFINGRWVNPIEGESIDVVDPASEDVITTIGCGGAEDVNIAVEASRKAFRTSWGLKVPGSGRGRILSKLADLIEEHSEELAALEALDVGKPFLSSKHFELKSVVQAVRYYAGWADKAHGKTIETNEKKLAYTRHEPWGVVGAIIPWNAPLMMAVLKIAPALATGNTVILKPSEVAPLSVLFLADLLNDAGIPPGVVNIVNGYGHTVGSAIASHPKIDKITFTGSSLTGCKILKASAASNLKAVTLELGGKSPTIIFNDATLEQAVQWAALGVFSNMGQICSAGSRIYVQDGIYDQFLKEFTIYVEGLTSGMGQPFEAATRHGPQVSKAQFERIMSYISFGNSEGAKIHFGGERFGEKGYFIRPTIFVDVKPSMKIMREEIFGPVCCVVKFRTEEEVLDWANDTTYGLAANVLTENAARAIRMAHALEAGVIYVNHTIAGDINVPFGGYKQSGLGREMGEEALATYTQVKAVHLNIGQVL
ncbi:hypothetical protein NP233_g4768 [Leucocoprinus birnbaumii]|uniref:Aldehyde dehydrogenase domain-containing protein n=1 Tax=Leucocoprinus birnbaumii TaxID=56174 RepID=A0AAD5VU78_9AGAR|nr:hypothetical protein NP233_g4768 [Leucocoprinus birnbaumii]